MIRAMSPLLSRLNRQDENAAVHSFILALMISCTRMQVVVLGDRVSSFMLYRGSLPVFWEQPGFQVRD